MQHVGTRGNAKDIASQEQLTGLTASQIHAATSKATPVDADELGLSDSAASWGLKKLTFANLAAWVRNIALTGLSTATNAVITASDTVIGALGKLQKQISDHLAATANAHAASAVSNTPSGGISATTVQDAINELDSEKFAKTGGNINGNVLVTGGALGYGVGSGGTVTQETSKTTGVAINKPSGFITMAQGSIPANGTVAFLVSNSTVANGDTVSVCLIAGITTAGVGYMVDAQAPQTGLFYIIVRNVSGTATPSTDQPTLQFNVHKGSRS